MKRGVMAVLVAASLLACLAPAAASTFIRQDTKTLVESSSAIVEGTVLDVQSYYGEYGVIKTEATVQVSEALTGAPGGVLIVETFGGQVGDYTVVAHGFPKFRRGERVLLFLTEGFSGENHRVTGYQQGQYELISKNGVEMAVPAIDGATFLKSNGEEAAGPSALPLVELRAQILSIIEGAEAPLHQR